MKWFVCASSDVFKLLTLNWKNKTVFGEIKDGHFCCKMNGKESKRMEIITVHKH